MGLVADRKRGKGTSYKVNGGLPLGDSEVYFAREIMEMAHKARHYLSEPSVSIWAGGGDDLVRKIWIIAMARTRRWLNRFLGRRRSRARLDRILKDLTGHLVGIRAFGIFLSRTARDVKLSAKRKDFSGTIKYKDW